MVCAAGAEVCAYKTYGSLRALWALLTATRLPSSLAVVQYERLGLATRRCVNEGISGSNLDSTGLLQNARGYKEAAWQTCMLSCLKNSVLLKEFLQNIRSTVIGLACI